MKIHRFPKAQRELAEIEVAQRNKRINLSEIAYETSIVTKVQAGEGAESATQKEGAAKKAQNKEKDRAAKKKA